MENKSQVAELIKERIRIIGKKQLQIAIEAGFETPNLITMIKQGKTKLPLGKIGSMAKALELDPSHLLKMCIKEYQPDTWEAISPYMEDILTEDELKMVLALRNAIGAPYLSALGMDQRKKLDCFIHSMNKDISTIQ